MDPDLVSTCFYLSFCEDLDSAFLFVKSEIYSTQKVHIRAGLLSDFQLRQFIYAVPFYSVELSYKAFTDRNIVDNLIANI